jgi:hypothetical protein
MGWADRSVKEPRILAMRIRKVKFTDEKTLTRRAADLSRRRERWSIPSPACGRGLG